MIRLYDSDKNPIRIRVYNKYLCGGELIRCVLADRRGNKYVSFRHTRYKLDEFEKIFGKIEVLNGNKL